MKKSFIFGFILIFILGLSCSAFAAASPFQDVPADHWAYKSIAQLAKAGLVEGYNDGTFRGSKTITRYEMAAIVADVVTKEDKANAESKAEIEKLKAEFSREFDILRVRVQSTEKRLDGAERFQFNMKARQIWQHSDAKNIATANPNDQFYFYRFFVNANLNPTTKFITMYEITDDITDDSTSQGGNFTAKQAYLKTKVGTSVLNIGRQPFSWLGNGLVCDNSGKWDGATFEFGSPSSKFWIRTGLAQRVNGAVNYTNGNGTGTNIPQGTRTYYMYNAKYIVNPDFNLVSVYLKDGGSRNGSNNGELYNTLSLGLNYNISNKWTLTNEFARNQGQVAKQINNNAAPKAWYSKLSYGHADQSKVGTWEFGVQYRKCDPGFDILGYTTLGGTRYITNANFASDMKGYDVNFNYIPFKNLTVMLEYKDLQYITNSNKSTRGYDIRLEYSF